MKYSVFMKLNATRSCRNFITLFHFVLIFVVSWPAGPLKGFTNVVTYELFSIDDNMNEK